MTQTMRLSLLGQRTGLARGMRHTDRATVTSKHKVLGTSPIKDKEILVPTAKVEAKVKVKTKSKAKTKAKIKTKKRRKAGQCSGRDCKTAKD